MDDEAEEAYRVREGDSGGTGQGYLDLKIYQQAHRLGVSAHYLSLDLPKHEMYETGSQLRRAAKSVSTKLVEGDGRRRYKAEYLRFLVYAKASLLETEEHLRYIRDCHTKVEGITELLKPPRSSADGFSVL